jgi:methylated-DNA-[protein]-cysteine S-methyltransferase
MKTDEKVMRLLQKIPKGKVVTYDFIAKRTGINPRMAGRILSLNEDPADYPCYKVIRKDGSLGGYTINGRNDSGTLKIKKRKLEADGVKFIGDRVCSSCIMS